MDLPLPEPWATASIRAHADPEAYERLYELAVRDQWTVAGLDWGAVDLREVPRPLREAAADLFVQLHYGELTAMLCAAKVLDRLPDRARDVCATQVSDEARHQRFFVSLLEKLGAEAEVREPVRRVMTDVYAQERPEALMLGTQLMIESVAHSFFLEGARVFGRLSELGPLPPAFASAQTIVTRWLPQRLARDESRHIALGVHYLRARIPELGRAERRRLEDDVERWGTMVLDSASDPDLLDNLGLDGRALSERCVEDLNLRLGQVGLESRIPTP